MRINRYTECYDRDFSTDKLLGTPLYGMRVDSDGAAVGDITVLRAGIFDDLGVLNKHKPELEIYINGRVNWLTTIGGADEFDGMLPPPSS